MKKKLLIILTIFLLTFSTSFPIHAASKIDAKAAIMVDASTGQIIYEQNADQQLPIASITKLLTLAVVHDELQQHAITDNTKVTVTPDIAAISNDPNYSSISLVNGQSYSVIELVNAAMVKSADGAVVALATADGNSLDEFVLKMEQKAHNIGLKHANIINPTGLTNSEMKSLSSNNIPANAENEMSAKDVAILSKYLIHSYPAILQVTAQKKANFFISKNNVKSIENLNKMLPGSKYTVPGVKINGLKTGTSDKAGACFVSTGKYKRHQIITVVLHANGGNKDNRFIQTQKLYKMLKQNYHLKEISLPKRITNVKIENGTQKNITTEPKKLAIWSNGSLKSYTISQNFNDKQINNSQNLKAPITKGQRIGSIKLTSPTLKTISGEPLTYPLYSNKTVQKGNFFERLFN